MSQFLTSETAPYSTGFTVVTQACACPKRPKTLNSMNLTLIVSSVGYSKLCRSEGLYLTSPFMDHNWTFRTLSKSNKFDFFARDTLELRTEV